MYQVETPTKLFHSCHLIRVFFFSEIPTFNLGKSKKRKVNEDRSICVNAQADPEVIKLFLCSTQLSTKFEMLISLKISRISAFFF